MRDPLCGRIEIGPGKLQFLDHNGEWREVDALCKSFNVRIPVPGEFEPTSLNPGPCCDL